MTFRGLLLNAYAFGTMTTIALIAGWIGLGGGLLLVALAGLGLVHARRTTADTELHVPGWHPEPVSAS